MTGRLYIGEGGPGYRASVTTCRGPDRPLGRVLIPDWFKNEPCGANGSLIRRTAAAPDIWRAAPDIRAKEVRTFGDELRTFA
jgi:hypothetical protein